MSDLLVLLNEECLIEVGSQHGLSNRGHQDDVPPLGERDKPAGKQHRDSS